MFLILDNYDSFVHNLARYFILEGVEAKVVRNDALSVEEIEAMAPEAIVISPGPCTPLEAGISIDAVKSLGSSTPIFGVCLGHQAIGEAYGAKTERGQKPVHGKASIITHTSNGLFEGLKSPLSVGRYHSLIVELPKRSPLVITARTKDGEIMAMRHSEHPVYGVQFHPESVMTEGGHEIVRNFVNIAKNWNASKRNAA